MKLLACTQYACGVEKRMDPDVIESKLDEITQQILMEMYGESRLDEEVRQRGFVCVYLC